MSSQRDSRSLFRSAPLAAALALPLMSSTAGAETIGVNTGNLTHWPTTGQACSSSGVACGSMRWRISGSSRVLAAMRLPLAGRPSRPAKSV